MPADQVPELLLGVRQSWKAVTRSLKATETLPQDLQNNLNEIARENNAVVDKAVKISRVLDQGVSLCRVPLNLSGWRYRSLDEIWKLHSATVLEKARLLDACLRAAGLSSQILVYSPRGWLDVEGPVLPQAEGYLVEVREDDSHAWYLDPAGKTRGLFPEKLRGRVVYRPDKDQFERLFDSEPAENRVDVSGELRFNGPEAVSGWVELHLDGAWVDYEKVMGNAAGTAETFLKRLLPLQKLSVDAVRELTPRSLRVRFNVEGVKLEQLSPGLYAFRPPGIHSLQPMMIAADRRLSPLELDHSLRMRARIAVVSGKDMVLQFVGKDLNMESGTIAFSRSHQTLDKGESRFNWEFRAPARIEVDQYPAFRKLAAQALAATPWFTIALPFTK